MTSNPSPEAQSHPSHPTSFPQSLTTPRTTVSLTYHPLEPNSILSSVRSPLCGANVLFLGSTRNNFESRPVVQLTYQAYAPLALRSFQAIALKVLEEFDDLEKVCIVHRLGEVPVGEDSIAIAVSAGHRQQAWKAGEEVLERCKERAEVWKLEVFGDGEGGEGVWRANKEVGTGGDRG